MLEFLFLACMSQDKWEYRTNSLSADWVCHVDIKMWFRSLFNMIHAVPCVKYLVSIAVTCVRDDFKVWWFIAITISYEIFEGSVCFFPGSFGANEASRRTRAAAVTWHVLKGVLNETIRTNPSRSCKIPMNWMFTVHSYFPSYRLLVTRSGYAMTVSGPATSVRLKFFVKMMLIKHRYKSKRVNRPWFCSTSRYIV